jgi:hypothetical protein
MLAALVAVGGIAFAAGRMSTEGDGGGQSVALASGASVTTDARAGRAQPGAEAPAGRAGSAGSVDDKTAAVDPGASDVGGDTVSVATAQLDAAADVAQEPRPAEPPDRSGEGIVGRPVLVGLEGSVSGFTADGFSLDAADGTTSEILTDASTAYVLETAIDATDLASGELVRVRFPFVRGATDDATASDPSIATLVTALPPETVSAAGRRGATQGSVVAVADDSLVLALASGETEVVPIDASTTFMRDADLTPDSLQLGDVVRIQSPRGVPADGGAVPTVAEQVTVVVPVTALAAE